MPLGRSQRRFLHIKRDTEGTSNELSFSVLDAKKNTARQSTKPSPRTVEEFGKVAVFTLPDPQSSEGSVTAVDLSGRRSGPSHRASAGYASYAGGGEVAQRKRSRRFGRVVEIGTVVLLAGALLFAAGSYLTQETRHRQGVQGLLDDAVALLEQTDETVLAVDELVNAAEVDTQASAPPNADIAAATSLLDRATNYAEEALVQTDDARLTETASEVKEAAAARKELLEQGKRIIDTGVAAKRATGYAEGAWERVLEGDQLASQAASVVVQTSAKTAEESSKITEQAVEAFQDARFQLDLAQKAYPDADFSAFSDYLNARIAAQQSALASNDGIIGQDRVVAERNSETYNSAEEEAAQLAELLPANPTQPALDAYAAFGQEADEAYQQARARASRADAALREYLKSSK